MKPETRKAVEASIHRHLKMIDPSGVNNQMYTEIFKTLDGKGLLKIIESRVPIFIPPNSPVYIDPYKVVDLAREEFGYEFRQHGWLTDPKTGIISKTKFKHLFIEVPIRRQTQMIEKKISIPKHNRTIDKLTHQPTGDSKSSGFSFPQSYIMFSQGYDQTLGEFLQDRGGNLKAMQVIDRNIRANGHSSRMFPGKAQTKTKSVTTGGIIYKCMHLGNNM